MKPGIFAFSLLLAAAGALTAAPDRLDRNRPFISVGKQGQIAVSNGHEALGGIYLAVHGQGWAYSVQNEAKVAKDNTVDGARQIEGTLGIPASGGKSIEYTLQVQPAGDRELKLAYRLHFPEAARLYGYQISFTFKAPRLAGKELVLTGAQPKSMRVPENLENVSIFTGMVNGVKVAPDSPEGFALAVDADTPLLVQDNRQYGGDEIELRFNFKRNEQGVTVPAGETVARTFTVRYNQPMQFVLDAEKASDATDTSGWVPFVIPWDRAPLDLSFLNDKPAGKHGFLTVKGDRFVFSDGTEAKFWGTCLSAGANFPSHEQAAKIAHRLASFGVNIVRTHHADTVWGERSLLDKKRDDSQHFDAEGLDRFDYFIYCLKREGIYVYLDQLVNRTFKPGDGVDAVDKLEISAKPYSNFDPRLIELQKKYSHDLWTHVNPYTGLAYKDDPAIALMEFANENDLFTQKVTLEPYRTRLEERYRAWAKENGITVAPDPVDFTVESAPITRFLERVQRNYYQEMGAYLRGIGVRVPMTGSNWSRNAALLSALSVTDYTDSHSYWDHPSDNYRAFSDQPMTASLNNVFGGLSFNRMAGKPFFVSEWDQPWPNEWRAEHPLAMASVAAFQGWNGLTAYTYRHSSEAPVEKLTGAFEMFNDPARFGLFYHAALIFRRGDVRQAKDRVTVVIPEKEVLGASSRDAWNNRALRGTPELHRVQMALAKAPANAGRVVDPGASLLPEKVTALVSDTGELRRDPKLRVGLINTARTQAAYGFTGEAGPLRLRDVQIQSRTPFATIAVSSLTERPIAKSSRLLLTAVGRSENTGFRYNILHTRWQEFGNGPILIEPIEADVRLRAAKALPVRPVLADGSYGAPLPVSYKGGWLSFHIGAAARTMYYEIGGKAVK